MTEPVIEIIQPCPECAVVKCGNCDGTTWAFFEDRSVPCPCAEAGHPGTVQT